MGNQTVEGSHSMNKKINKKYYGRQWLMSTVWLLTFFILSSLVFSRSKNSFGFGRTWRWWQSFHFWV